MQVKLTKKNLILLEFIKIGYTNTEISKTLGITRKTVENLVRSLIKRFGVKNRCEMIYRALQQERINLVDPDLHVLKENYKAGVLGYTQYLDRLPGEKIYVNGSQIDVQGLDWFKNGVEFINNEVSKNDVIGDEEG